MHIVRLRKVGGSVMLAVPPTLLKLLDLRAGAQVELLIDDGRLVVKAKTRPHYTLNQLLAESASSGKTEEHQTSWVTAAPVGAELI